MARTIVDETGADHPLHHLINKRITYTGCHGVTVGRGGAFRSFNSLDSCIRACQICPNDGTTCGAVFGHDSYCTGATLPGGSSGDFSTLLRAGCYDICPRYCPK
ncbi:unnamed protein product [Rotaria sordida]|uniref:Uncharacterized protein n=1 Tax=Rotaria sordida TaxID=392033 RepID=A0A815FYZ2_9BILA|nr:unnamed protein product [Rotaria sordida]CAF3866689.1 unnamed protein product [Rotaria sordida]